MNKLFLNMVMLLSGLWRSLGADVTQLRAILQVRLLMDDRKPMSFGRQQQKKSFKYGSILNVFIFLVMGFIYMLPITVVTDRIYSLTLYFSTLLVVMTFMLITDFSSVLFDARDKFILFPRPVDDRTLVLARMLHVFIYLFRMIIPLSLPAWVLLGYMDGWKSAVLFPLPLLLMLFLALFLVNSIYLLVLRLAKPEKFKDIISYFQVITTAIFFASVYLLPRLFDVDHPQDFNILDHPALRYVPSYWLAACWSWLGYPVNLHGTAAVSALAVICPLLCMYILIRWLSPQFSRRIAGIDTADAGEYKPAVAARSTKSRLYQRLAYAFNRTDDAKAGFMITWLQTSRSRTFRMRVLPSFVFVPIYFIYFLTQHHSFNAALQNLPHGPLHLVLLYMSSFVMVSALNYITISDQYKAAWVYYATPVAVPGRIMIGAFKAIWVKYFLPFFIVISAFVLYVWGTGVIVDVLLAMINVTLFVACMARVSHKQLPFSIMEQMKQGGSRLLKSFIIMIIPAVLGFGHYMALNLWWLKLIFLGLSAILLWLIADSYTNTTWDNMMRTNEE